MWANTQRDVPYYSSKICVLSDDRRYRRIKVRPPVRTTGGVRHHRRVGSTLSCRCFGESNQAEKSARFIIDEGLPGLGLQASVITHTIILDHTRNSSYSSSDACVFVADLCILAAHEHLHARLRNDWHTYRIRLCLLFQRPFAHAISVAIRTERLSH